MTAILALFWQKNWGSILIVIGVLAVVSAIYLKGRSDEASKKDEAARTAVFDQIKERYQTDGQVQRMSDADLCRSIGGKLQDGRCL
jgi:type II secretory pathway pseudopilin PulG